MSFNPDDFYTDQKFRPGYVIQGHVFVPYDDPYEEDDEWDVTSVECDNDRHVACEHCECCCHWA